MADLGTVAIITKIPSVFDYSNVGTAAGTTTVSSYPCFVHGVTITRRPASGTVILYDSVGTSATEIARIICGTQTFSDPPPTYMLDVRTKTALTVENTANVGAVVSFGK